MPGPVVDRSVNPKSRIQVRSSLALTLLLLLLTSACGKIGEPVPPQARGTLRTQRLEVLQQGSAVLLYWPQPDLSQLRRLGFRLARFDIYRNIGGPAREDADPLLFSERAQVVGTLNAADLARIPAGQPLQYRDEPLRFYGRRLVYAVRFVAEGGRAAPFSNLAALSFEGAVPEAPTELRVIDQAQDVVFARWRAPVLNIDGSGPPAVIGYNLYRREPGAASQPSRLNRETPITTLNFLDQHFDYGRRYIYTVRAVSRSGEGRIMESADAGAVEYAPVDRFPPATPEGLTAVSANLVINLFWTANSEPDVAGYNIYRATASDSPAQWTKINVSIHTLTTYRDENTARGVTYLYRITAVDRSGNESVPSAAVAQEAN